MIGEQRFELHLIENVFLQFATCGYFDESKTFGGEFKDGALGDVKHLLPLSDGRGAVETDVLDLPHKFGLPLRQEGAAKDKSASALSDVYKATDSGKTARKAGDVHAAFRIHLHRAEHGDVESAAVVEIELRRLVDDGLGKVAATKV